ncbi:MAG: tetratricopeptide repeat protein, partial [Dokdonella sp.]
MTSNPLRILLGALALTIASPVFSADALLKPLPSGELSRLPPAQAKWLRDERADFDAAKAALLGGPLVEAYARIGSAYGKLGLYDVAEIALYDASQLAPEVSGWIYAQGLIADAQKQSAAAVAFYSRAIAIDKNYLPYRIAFAEAKLRAGDAEAGRAQLSQYAADTADEPRAHAVLGDIAMAQKKYPEAIAQYQLALKFDPQANAVEAKLADAYTASGDAKSAATARAKAGHVAARLTDPVRDAIVGAALNGDEVATEIAKATFFSNNNRYAAALESLDAALRLQPNDPQALAFHARVDAISGNLAQASQRAQAALAAAPNSAVVLVTDATIKEMTKDDAGADASYRKAIAGGPTFADARLRYGTFLMRTGKTADALAQFKELTRLEPARAEGWAYQTAAEVVLGRCADALQELTAQTKERPKNLLVRQLFVRIAATCKSATAEQRKAALADGGNLYTNTKGPDVADAFALALAANGRWEDAVQIESGAM